MLYHNFMNSLTSKTIRLLQESRTSDEIGHIYLGVKDIFM